MILTSAGEEARFAARFDEVGETVVGRGLGAVILINDRGAIVAEEAELEKVPWVGGSTIQKSSPSRSRHDDRAAG